MITPLPHMFVIKHSHAAKMFYLFFKSRTNKKDPVGIWLIGSPECSIELAIFYENAAPPWIGLRNLHYPPCPSPPSPSLDEEGGHSIRGSPHYTASQRLQIEISMTPNLPT
ncbi:hypothetical protein FF1_027717 [Malus domestica]